VKSLGWLVVYVLAGACSELQDARLRRMRRRTAKRLGWMP
jgi:hypothetical protein